MWSAVVTAVTESLGIAEDDKLFSDAAGWTASEKHPSCRQSVSDLCSMHPDSGPTKSAVGKMPVFLDKPGGNVVAKLAFACELWMVATCIGQHC